MSDKTIMFKMSPELSDGQNNCIAPGVDYVLATVRTWLEEAKAGNYSVGEGFKIEVLEMSQADFDRMATL